MSSSIHTADSPQQERSRMSHLKIFRVITFLFGLVPSALLCVLAAFLVTIFFRQPTISHIIPLLWGLGGFAGTLGFVLVIFRTGRHKILTSILLVWGLASISPFNFFMIRHPNIWLLLYGTIMMLGILSLWVEIKTRPVTASEDGHADVI